MTVMFQVVGEDEKWARRGSDFDDAAWTARWGNRYVQFTNQDGCNLLEALDLLDDNGDPCGVVPAAKLAALCRRVIAEDAEAGDPEDANVRRLLVFAEHVDDVEGYVEVKFG